MNSDTNTEKGRQGPAAPKPIVRIILSIVIIAVGIAGVRYLLHTKPKANRRPPVKMAPLVKTAELKLDSYMIKLPVMGAVIPAREMVLKVPVAGEIIEMNPEFTPGGLLQENAAAHLGPAVLLILQAVAEAVLNFDVGFDQQQDLARERIRAEAPHRRRSRESIASAGRP